jgi:hypothetical protein
MVTIRSDYNTTIPWGLHGSAAPVWVSTTSISIDSMLERSWDDTVDMIKTTSTTVSTAATGANGILTSSILGGTVSITSSSITGTGTQFSTDFVAGDMIGIYNGSMWQTFRIKQVSSNTAMTAMTAASTNVTNGTYRRGGNALTAIHYLYAISYPDGSNPAFALSGRSVATGETLVDLPSGYTKYRQLPVAFLTSPTTGSILEFDLLNWPLNPKYLFRYYQSSNIAYGGSITQVFCGVVPTTMTVVDCSQFIPKIGKNALFNTWNNSSTVSRYYLADNSSNIGQIVSYGAYSVSCNVAIACTASQSFMHGSETASLSVYLNYRGYIITESV